MVSEYPWYEVVNGDDEIMQGDFISIVDIYGHIINRNPTNL